MSENNKRITRYVYKKAKVKKEMEEIENTREYLIGLVLGIQKGIAFQKKLQKYQNK